MNADLVDLPAGFENVTGTELYAKAAAFASVVNYENVGVPKLQSLRRLDGVPAGFGWAPGP